MYIHTDSIQYKKKNTFFVISRKIHKAISNALFMGANILETVKVLLNAGASLDARTFTGGTVLINFAANEDSDPEVLRLLLEKLKSSCGAEKIASILNYKKRSTTLKWKGIDFVAKVLYRMGISKSVLIKFLANESGITPLNKSVVRGDVEIVKIFLENGTDPYVENDLGMNAFEICEKSGPFPTVTKALLEFERKVQ